MEIPEVKLSKLTELENEVSRTRAFIKDNWSPPYQPLEHLLFRGHSDSEWKLQTTLERYTRTRYSIGSYNLLLGRVLPAIETFSGRIWDFDTYNKEEDHSLFITPPNSELMTYLRHLGFPSPLLDWTQSLYIALFFAFNDVRENHDVAIYTYIDAPKGAKSAIGGESVIHQIGPYVATHKRHFNQ